MTEEMQTKTCPYCGEEININAIKCKHCGEFLNENKQPEQTTEPETKICPFCGEEIAYKAVKCKHCGEFLDGNSHIPIQNASIAEKGLPYALQKFNWGAFWGTWIWGVANKCYFTLWSILIFLLIALLLMQTSPIVITLGQLPVMIVFGILGNKWAWQHKSWKNVNHFNDVQKKWALWCSIIGGIGLFLNICMSLE